MTTSSHPPDTEKKEVKELVKALDTILVTENVRRSFDNPKRRDDMYKLYTKELKLLNKIRHKYKLAITLSLSDYLDTL